MLPSLLHLLHLNPDHRFLHEIEGWFVLFVVLLVKALVTWPVKTLWLTREPECKPLHPSQQNHCLILFFSGERIHTLYSPHVKREPLQREETALHVKH